MPSGWWYSLRVPRSQTARPTPSSATPWSKGFTLPVEIAVEGLCAGYGQVNVLREVILREADAETVVLLGTNGNGKSTLMKSLMGIVRPTSGRIEVTIDDQKLDLMRMSTAEIVDHGISLVPEGRHLFAKLTVAASLKLGAYRGAARAKAERSFGNRSPSGVLPIRDQSVNARAFVQRQRGRSDERGACGVTTRSEATGAIAS